MRRSLSGYMANKRAEFRIEKDLQGEMQIASGAYYGLRTARARERLFTCGFKFHPKLVDAMLTVKKAAAFVNADLGRIDNRVASAIMQACDEALTGQWREQFVAEPFQSGSGMTFNINVNEVLANRAEEILGGNVGDYALVFPDVHVNLGQSANDVFPSAMRIAVLLALKDFEPALLDLERLLRRKALEFAKVIKFGRTHLRDAAPVTLGQEFNAFGSAVERSLKRIKESSLLMLELNIGGTFVGSGLDAHPLYAAKAVEKLVALTGFKLRQGEDLFRMTQSMADFLSVSSSLKELAVELSKIANDLRLLSSGPSGGLAEINLPATESEPSALLPGQLPDQASPLLAESLNMVAFQVIGNDLSTTFASHAGQLEANVMTPVIIHNLLQSIELLQKVIFCFNQRCLSGITANTERCRQHFDASGGLLAVLTEQVGFELANSLCNEFGSNSKAICNALTERQLVTQEVMERIANPLIALSSQSVAGPEN